MLSPKFFSSNPSIIAMSQFSLSTFLKLEKILLEISLRLFLLPKLINLSSEILIYSLSSIKPSTQQLLESILSFIFDI